MHKKKNLRKKKHKDVKRINGTAINNPLYRIKEPREKGSFSALASCHIFFCLSLVVADDDK